MNRTLGLWVGFSLIALSQASCTSVQSDPVADEEEIAALLNDLPRAWNQRDAEAWVGNFTDASGFTNILGMHFEDRTANRRRHAELFSTIFSESELLAEVLDVRFVGRDAAVAEIAFELTGYARLPPGIGETEPGVLRTRLLSVLERRDGRWRIVEAQNTAISAAAGRPPG